MEAPGPVAMVAPGPVAMVAPGPIAMEAPGPADDGYEDVVPKAVLGTDVDRWCMLG